MIAQMRAEAHRIKNTFIWSYQGWVACWASEKSLRQWTLANAISAALAFGLDLTALERALILTIGLLILAAELINTAVETVVNRISLDHDPLSKKAKDAGSACVAVTALAGGVAWVVILIG